MARSPAMAPTTLGGSGSDPTMTSTLGDIIDTTSPYSFAPTLTSDGTLATTITRASDASSVSVTGSTTTTPTATLTAANATLGDSFHCETVATKDGLTNTLVTTVFMEAVGGGGPSRLVDIDFTTDITDLTLTMNGGDTNLRNAADTATKAVVGAYDRVGTPTATIAITAANAGAKITSQGSSVEADMYTKLVAATEGMDFSDPSKIYMVSCRMSGQSLATDADTIGVWISPNADFNNVNGSWGGQQYRQTSSSFRLRGIRYLAGGFGIGSDVDDDATVQDTCVHTFVIYKGRLADVYITEGSTIPSGFPTTGASLFKMDGGSDAVAVEQTFNLYSTNLYVHGQVFTSGAADSVTVIERITVDEWSL